MAVAKWAAPGTRSSNFAGSPSAFNSLANGSESAVVTYDNSSNRNLYGAVTLKLGSITPAAGGYVTLRITLYDGTDTADKAAGDIYSATLLSGASAKVVIFPMVRIYPFSLRFSLINNSGVTLASSGNEIYLTPYNEDVS
jgi:hypothetical protein